MIEPLRRDFEETKKRVTALLAEDRRITTRTRPDRNPTAVFNAFLDRVRAVRVLDPACGSGNFLYLALRALKDLEREAILWGSLALSTPMQFPQVGPEAVRGIEVNSYAAELARVVIWIGEIQWMLANGFAYRSDPILRPLDNIECRDAVLDLDDPAHPVGAGLAASGHASSATRPSWAANSSEPTSRMSTSMRFSACITTEYRRKRTSSATGTRKPER